MKIYFVRHGESLGNVDSRAYFEYHDHDIPLTDRGREQSCDVGNRICGLVQDRPFRIIHSPFLRALDTAKIIDRQCILNGKYARVSESPLLYERSWGNLRGIVDNAETLELNMYFNFFYRPTNGESFADVYQRVVLFFQELRQDLCQDDIVIVSHGEWIRLALMYLRGYSVKYFNDNHKSPENCCCIIENL
jgi:2,3-bisphosphoglycerate-dependent phosphoglycerate mutase